MNVASKSNEWLSTLFNNIARWPFKLGLQLRMSVLIFFTYFRQHIELNLCAFVYGHQSLLCLFPSVVCYMQTLNNFFFFFLSHGRGPSQ